MMKLTVEIRGHDWNDLESFLDEVMRSIEQRYIDGSNRSKAGDFHFSVEGDPEESDRFSG